MGTQHYPGGWETWLNASGTLTVTGAITNRGYPLTIAANSDVRLAGRISGSGGLTRNGSARLIMQGNHDYSGPSIIAAASGTTTALEVGAADLGIPNSDLTLNGRMDLGNHDATVGALNGTGLNFANDLTRTLTLGANGHSGAFPGILQNSASGSGVTLNVVKTGGGTQVLSGANTHSGVTAVMEGVLLAANAAALGSAAAGTIVGSGATLALSNNITVGLEPLTLVGTGMAGSGALRNDYGFNTFNGSIALSGPAQIRAAAGRLTLGGACNTAGNNAALSFHSALGADILVSAGIEGGGAINKIGPGTLRLYGTNNYSGLTTISEGMLALNGSGSVRRSSGVILGDGATLNVSGLNDVWTLLAGQFLQGHGTVLGSSKILGTLLPGNTLGVTTFNGDVVLGGVVVLNIARTGALLTNDVLKCSATLTPGGVLNISCEDAESLVPGDGARLFDAANFGSGAFSSVNLPGLAPGLAWDISRLCVDGTVSVQAAAPPQIALKLDFRSNPGTLTISWPVEYSNYTLQAQTNGLESDWFLVPGVISNNLVIPIDPGNRSALYRLVRP